MPVIMTARFTVREDSLDTARTAIEEFVAYIREHEPGTQLYTSLHKDGRPTEFLHYFIFDDAAAEEIHRNSEAVKRFTGILYPVLASDGVTDNLHVDEIVEATRKGPLEAAADAVVRHAEQRMRTSASGQPSKPDDLSLIVFRKPPVRQPRVARSGT